MQPQAEKFEFYGAKHGKGDTFCCMIEFCTKPTLQEPKVMASFMEDDTPTRYRILSTVYSIGFPQAVSVSLNTEVRVHFAECSAKSVSLKFHKVCDARLENGLVPLSIEELHE